MPTVADVARRALSDEPDPFVAPFHSRWQELDEHEQIYSERAIQHSVDVYRKKHMVPRAGRLSPSMLGRCKRESLFTFAGAPKLPESPESKDLMDAGKKDHLHWQMEGLSFPFDAPYMTEVEKFVIDRAMRFGGSIDGILRDGSIFELKTVFWSVMNKVMENGPHFEHLMQLAGYWMLTGIPNASFIYYERGLGSYWEVRILDIDKNNRAVEAAEEEVEDLNQHIDRDSLPDMLNDCRLKVGKVYKDCRYRNICPLMQSVKQASELPHPKKKEDA
jgi:hypothetical protein